MSDANRQALSHCYIITCLPTGLPIGRQAGIIALSHYHIITLSHYHIIALSHYHIITLSHYPNSLHLVCPVCPVCRQAGDRQATGRRAPCLPTGRHAPCSVLRASSITVPPYFLEHYKRSYAVMYFSANFII